MKISLIQTDIIWEDVTANLTHFENKLKQCKSSDIIVLPEMFTTGFTLRTAGLAETMDGKTVHWMKSQAEELDALIIGTVIIEEDEKYYNRCLCVFPNNKIAYYDKKHLFVFHDEDKSFTAGTKSLIITYKQWRIRPLICYDLRFPVWARNTDKYDILIYMASWPEKRSHAWKQLLIARAIENQSYVIGVNRLGKDENELSYTGDSSIINYLGEILKRSNKDEVISYDLDYKKQQIFRKQLPFLHDMDNFTLNSENIK